MADANQKNFSKRVRNINKKRRKLMKGSVVSVNHDGLVIARVSHRAPKFPWKGVALCFVAIFVFKGFLLVQLGESSFNDRISKLESGTVVEQAGAYAMSADPLTKWIAKNIQSFFP